MAKLKLGVIVGSNHNDSINRKLALALARLGSDAFDAKFIKVDDLPLYDQDEEQPVPATVARFKSEVEASDALLVVTPEHSRTIPTLLKNVIDWGARPWGKTSWPDKPTAVTGTSAGVISTALAQFQLRAILSSQGAHVMGGEAYIQFKPDMIDANNDVPDENTRKFLKAYVDKFAAFAAKLAS